MGKIYFDEREVFQNEKAISLSSNNIVGWEEEDHLGSMALKLKAELEKRSSNHHLFFNARHPFSSKLSIPDYISFFSIIKNLAQYHTDLAEQRAASSLILFCRTASLINIPLNLRPSGFIVESLKHRRRTRSTNDLGNLFVEYTAIVGSENVIISPSVQLIFDSMEVTLMSRALLKSPLIFHLGTLDSAISPVRARSFNTGPIKNSAERSSSPSWVCNASSQEPKVEQSPSSSQSSELKITERLLISCSSANSTSSHQSISSPQHSISKGMLHCVWKNGSPYFMFRTGEDCGKLYVAYPRKVESSIDKALDYVYLFHSSTGNKATEFVGKMKVLSSLVFSSTRSKLMETEFVLFGANEDHSKEMNCAASTAVKSKGLLSKKMTDIFRLSQSSKHKPTCKIEPSSQIEDYLREPCLSEFSDFDESVPLNYLENDFPPNLELGAIVVKDSRHASNKEAAVGGWGLKFLEKVAVDHVDTSLDLSIPSESCEGSHTKGGGSSDRSMNVLVPAGFHGGPITRIGGPSSLTERWRSGGHCDCGGWDIGCPLTVLQDKRSIVSDAFPQDESQEDCKSVYLYIEGAKSGEPTLKMVNMNEDMYIMYFQSTLSALQSFSIGVAIIHAQTPALYPKL